MIGPERTAQPSESEGIVDEQQVRLGFVPVVGAPRLMRAAFRQAGVVRLLSGVRCTPGQAARFTPDLPGGCLMALYAHDDMAKGECLNMTRGPQARPLDPHEAPASALLTTTEAAAYLRLHVGTLCNWRTAQTGPPYVKLGTAVRYRRGDLDAWMR